MRRQKKPDKKERNYSIWLTGMVLILVYTILLDNISGTTKGALSSILMSNVKSAAEQITPF